MGSVRQGDQDRMRKPTEKADPSLWELRDSRLADRESAWDQTRPSACASQLFSLVYLWGPSGTRIYPLAHELTFGTHCLWWDSCSSLMQRGGLCFCLNLIVMFC